MLRTVPLVPWFWQLWRLRAAFGGTYSAASGNSELVNNIFNLFNDNLGLTRPPQPALTNGDYNSQHATRLPPHRPSGGAAQRCLLGVVVAAPGSALS